MDAILDIAAAWQPVFASSRQIVGDEVFNQAYPDLNSRKRTRINDPAFVWVAEEDGGIVDLSR